MLRFFRINDPYRLLAVLLLLVALAVPMFINPFSITLPELRDIALGELLNTGKAMYLQVVDDTPWFSSWLNTIVNFLFGRSLLARHLIALLIIFFQASFFAFVLIRNRAYNEGNFLPAFIFGVLCFFSFDMLSLSRELYASIFLLFALNNIFKAVEFKVQQDETVFNIGVYLGVASLLIFSYAIFLIGSLVILFIYARITLRKSLLLAFGFAFPHLTLLCFYYYRGGLPELVHYFYQANFTLHSINLISWKSVFWLSLGIQLFFLFAVIMLNRASRFTRYQSQLMQVMLIWLIISCLEIAITRELTPHSFITFIPSLTYFIAHYILLIRRKWIGEAMIWIFLFSIIGIGTAARLNKIKLIDYRGLYASNSSYDSIIHDKQVMILESDWGIYKHNKANSFFFNWDLSKEIFEQPDFYENIILVQHSFERDNPDVIIDEHQLMENFFLRLPSLRGKYQKEGNLYAKKSKQKTEHSN